MNLHRILLSQGVIGLLLFTLFTCLCIASVVVCVVRSKQSGLALYSSAWLVGAILLVFTARGLLQNAAHPAPGPTFMEMQTANFNALIIFVKILLGGGCVTMLALSVVRFSKKTIVVEAIISLAILLMFLAAIWTHRAIGLMFAP